MGDPAIPTTVERETALETATAIVTAVREDREGPLALPSFREAKSRNDAMHLLTQWWGHADIQIFLMAQGLVDTNRALQIACQALKETGKPEHVSLAARLRALDLPDDNESSDAPPAPSAA